MPASSSFPYRRFTILLTVALLVGACTSDDVTAPPGPEEGAMTVDARSGWVYVSLSDSAVVTPSPTPGASANWDIAFNATSVMLNGGEAGPGGVTGACVCQNASATDAQVLVMTPATEEADFQDIATVPAGLTFTSETFVPAITGWYSGSGANAVAEPGEAFLVRLADGTSYAKVRVTALTNPSSGSAGTVMLEYAVQADEASALGATSTIGIDVSSGAQQVDLNTGTVGASVSGWDLELEGFTIRLNGGASGSGQAGAADATEAFAAITSAATHASAYVLDAYAGVFNQHRWYRYNLAGDNRISPTFDVYVLKRGNVSYAVQIVNYYDATNQPRHVSFRFRRIGG